MEMITRKRCVFCNLDNRQTLEDELDNMIITADDLDVQMDWSSGTASRHQRNHMEGYVNSSNPRCNICISEHRSEIELQLHGANITPEEVGLMLNCTADQVVRHIKNHVQPLVQQSAANMIAMQEINEVDTLSANISRLDIKLDMLFDSDDLDAKHIDSLTKLAKEVRESLRYLMEFKGKLVHKRQDTIIVHQMQIIKEVLAQNHPEVWLDVRSKMEKLQ
jgi:hypothetical protein